MSLVEVCGANSKTHTVDYRFAFNGKEQDNEVKGDGNSLDFGARIHDSRLGSSGVHDFTGTIDPVSGANIAGIMTPRGAGPNHMSTGAIAPGFMVNLSLIHI